MNDSVTFIVNPMCHQAENHKAGCNETVRLVKFNSYLLGQQKCRVNRGFRSG